MSFYEFYNKKSKNELIEKLRLAFVTLSNIEQSLAEILGYPKSDGGLNDPNDGKYITGEHSAETLVEELKAILKRKDIWLNRSKCPGYPHEGHASSDWTCPLDR